jgi:hypothetical protein
VVESGFIHPKNLIFKKNIGARLVSRSKKYEKHCSNKLWVVCGARFKTRQKQKRGISRMVVAGEY